ncbi:BtrH N-terminal domain-containing protein, partial [Marinitenerispora sediminis]
PNPISRPPAGRPGADPPPYRGQRTYCYADSVSMLLAGHGHDAAPEFVEVLSGVGLGAILLPDDLLVLGQVPPDVGIDNALHRLGFQFRSERPGTAAAAWRRLAELLPRGPVLIGPLDQAGLPYHPPHPPGEVDHFVVGFAIEDDHLLLHDPGGFPHVRLDRETLLRAWCAEEIGYRRGSYQLWHSPTRADTGPTALADALGAIRADYSHAAGAPWPTGAAALRAGADLVAKPTVGRLIRFELPLATVRAGHYADFFRTCHRPEAADLCDRKARVCGEAYSAAATGDAGELARLLRLLAEIEEELAADLLR